MKQSRFHRITQLGGINIKNMLIFIFIITLVGLGIYGYATDLKFPFSEQQSVSTVEIEGSENATQEEKDLEHFAHGREGYISEIDTENDIMIFEFEEEEYELHYDENTRFAQEVITEQEIIQVVDISEDNIIMDEFVRVNANLQESNNNEQKIYYATEVVWLIENESEQQ